LVGKGKEKFHSINQRFIPLFVKENATPIFYKDRDSFLMEKSKDCTNGI